MSDHADTIRAMRDVLQKTYLANGYEAVEELRGSLALLMSENATLVLLLAGLEQFVEDVREWAAVAATTSDHPLLELLAEYDAGRQS